MNNLDLLPSELISLILQHADRHDYYACSLINKYLYIETMPLLWDQVDIDSEDALINMIITTTTSSQCPGSYVRSLTITIDNISATEIFTFMPHLPRLEHLKLEGGYVILNTDNSEWHSLKLQAPFYFSTLHTKTDFPPFALPNTTLRQRCPLLTCVVFERCHGMTADVYDALNDYCNSLKEITIKQCHMYGRMNPSLVVTTTNNNSTNPSSGMLTHITQWQHLTTLWMDDYPSDYTWLMHTVWPHLTRFCINACHHVDDTLAIQFLQAHPQLEHLKFGRNDTHITDRTLDAIATYLPKVKKVIMFKIHQLTATGVCRLVRNCASLEDEGIWCTKCGIYVQDDDFPRDLDRRFYEIDFGNTDNPQIVWIAGNAFL